MPSDFAHHQVTKFSSEEAITLMYEGGIDAAVILLPPWGPGAFQLAINAVRHYPGRLTVMGLTGARRAGVAVKAIGVPGYSSEAYAFPTIRT